jgi:hypothetical protein
VTTPAVAATLEAGTTLAEETLVEMTLDLVEVMPVAAVTRRVETPVEEATMLLVVGMTPPQVETTPLQAGPMLQLAAMTQLVATRQAEMQLEAAATPLGRIRATSNPKIAGKQARRQRRMARTRSLAST